jgi:hypothetical protein
MNMPVDLHAYPKLAIHKLFSIAGASLQIKVPDGPDVLFCKMKAFKLKEDITLYTNKDMQEAVINIKARQVIDFSASYDVFDCTNQTKIGALRRHGWKSSFFKDTWTIMDERDKDIGMITEDNAALAIARRLVLGSIIPQHYHLTVSENKVGHVARMPIINVLNINFEDDQMRRLDRRLGVAAGILLSVIEGMEA